MGLCTIRVSTDPELPQVKGGSSGLLAIRLQLHLVTRVKERGTQRPLGAGVCDLRRMGSLSTLKGKNDGNQSQRDRRKASCK